MGLILGLAFYIIETLPIYVIAAKSAHQYAWLAFVPLANLWLLCDMAALEWFFLLIWFLPFINMVFLAIVWWRIAENTNKPGWLGVLMVVPLVNLAAGYYLAFGETGRLIA